MSEASNEESKKDNFMEQIMKSRSSWKIDFEMLQVIIGLNSIIESIMKENGLLSCRERFCF